MSGSHPERKLGGTRIKPLYLFVAMILTYAFMITGFFLADYLYKSSERYTLSILKAHDDQSR